MPRMYIAGPLFNGNYVDLITADMNLEKGINICQKLMQKGWSPYLPHYSIALHTWQIRHMRPIFSWERWIQLDQEFLEVCTALFFFGHSKGADRELKWALDNDYKIYTDIDQVPTIEKGDMLTDEETRGLGNSS